MKNVKIGKLAGFCGGVDLCINTLKDKLVQYSKLYCIGDVVHNKDVVDRFKMSGLIVVDSIDKIPDGEISVIRAHGAEKELYEEAKRRNISLIDLTCPKVLKIRDFVKNDIDKDDTFIILFGEKTHPETKSTFSFCGKNSIILSDKVDLEDVIKKCKKYKKIIVIRQTTFNEKLFLECCDILKEKLNKKELVINNTICNATHMRQLEVEEMAKENECMIIIGGKNSSNTNKLNEISKTYCYNTIFIENVNELNIKDVKGFKSVGIMAGASTPKDIIDEVYNKLIEE